MQDLPMKIGHVHLVAIHQAQCSYTSASEIQRCRTSQATGADNQHLGGSQFQLA